ncbi:hypothetical protein CPC08DRAFT_724771 [Agrocybe pediades]|nr:hypothetical protein CPC08DRAFT_724771 [Agrocybe pediades]
MFEEFCLVCGKHVEDNRAYCSEDCQNSELSSPSISSASSVLSSPNMGYAAGSDVPPLMPSALGYALNKLTRPGFHVSSSSSSSKSYSVFTDEEDDSSPQPFIARHYGYHDAIDSVCDTTSKSAGFSSIHTSALSYARRPSGINDHSTVPHLHTRRMSSSSSASSAGLVRSHPRSALIASRMLSDEDDILSDFASSSGDAADTDDGDLNSENDWGSKPKSPDAAKSRRNRNRASLPACFSILKMSSPTKENRSSPVSSSSGNTIARPSPPTPKVPFNPVVSQLRITPTVTPLTAVQSTPRGRRRETDHSRSSRRSSHSRSRSRSHRIPIGESPRFVERSLPVRDAPEAEVDFWAMEGPIQPRGRMATRRNSSPPPKFVGLDNSLLAALRRKEDGNRSNSRSGSRPRGRARVEELGFATSTDAPGFGYGRSGLLARERGAGQARIPL